MALRAYQPAPSGDFQLFSYFPTGDVWAGGTYRPQAVAGVYFFKPIAASDAEEISRWRYPEPYTTYNGDPASVPGLLDPRYNYHAVTVPDGELVGYFCFGADATVPAGRKLGLYDEDALDVGLGMRPDLTGRGLGPDFVRAGLRFARQTFSPPAFRLTVAAFNRRAVKVYEAVGFEVIHSFGDRGVEWLLMRRPA
jgi:GNAT superfamily N-acetyltransferase